MAFADELMSKADEIEELVKIAWMVYFWGMDDVEGYGVRDTYKPFTERDPDVFDPIIEQLDACERTLRDPLVMQNMNYVGAKTDDWQGPAADEFVDFVGGFDTQRENQIDLVREVKAGLVGSQAIVRQTRTDIMGIADATIATLEQFIESKKESHRTTFLAVVSAIAVIGTAVLVAPAIAAALTVLAGVASGASAISADISGDNPGDIMSSHNESVTKLHEAIEDQERDVGNALAEDRDTVDAHMHMYLAPRPAVADDRGGDHDDFRLPTNPGS